MQDHRNHVSTAPERVAWNKGKLIGAKPPLRPKHVWSIRTKLQIQGRTRDLAMFNLAIDSKLRGCDVVAIKSRTLRRMDMRSTEQRSARRRPACRSDSRSPNTPAKRSTTTSAPPVENRATSCLAAGVDEAGALQHGNTPAWLPDGSRALGLIPAGSARIHCVEPRPR
jgi:hypothetical protein